MRSRITRGSVVALIGAIAVTACGGAAAPPTAPPGASGAGSPSAAGSAAATGPVEVGFPSTPDAADTLMLLAFERLNEQGWDVQPVFFAQPEAAFGALATGEIQIGVGAVSSALAAQQAGGNFKIIAEQEGIPWSIVVAAGIDTCDDLVGKRFALHSTGGTTTTYANYWIGEECSPESKDRIEPIYIPGSENRAAALLSGQIDASLLTAQDIALLEEQAPGKFRALANFGESSSLAKLNSSVIAAHGGFLSQNQPRLVELLRALRTAYSDAQADPSILAPVAETYNVQWTEAVQEAVRLELESGTLDPQLLITPESVDFTIQFFQQYGEVQPGLSSAAVADFGPIQAAGQ